MTRLRPTQIKRHRPTWFVGALVLLCGIAVGPATASASAGDVDETCYDAAGPEHTSGDRITDDELAAATMATEQLTGAASDDDADSPCSFDDHDSPSYNICLAANPRPTSTMPKWVARLHADDVASTVFERAGALHGDAPPAVGPVAHPPSPPPWFTQLVDDLRRKQLVGQPMRVCFDGEYDEECHDLPSEAVLVTAGFSPPALRSVDDIELPTTPEDDDRMQSPLVELRVGPSAGHHSPPDRPPPV